MADKEHLVKIRQGVKAWNIWREEHPELSIDLSGADLSEVDLIGANLVRTNLSGANLNYTNLSKAKIVGMHFGANLRGAYISEANLSGMNLKGVILEEARLIESNLKGVDLSGSILNKAVLNRANLSEAGLCATKLIKARLVKTILNGAGLNGATLLEADLHGAKLIGASLACTNLAGANLKEADLSGAKLNRTILIDSNLSGVNFSKAILKGAILKGANLNKAVFNKADLSEVDLSGAKLIEAKLNETILSHTTLNGADLSMADFNKANLCGVSLINSHLVKTNLEGAKLIDCNIYGISTWDVNLKETIQKDLIISPPEESVITVDNLEVAQFIYLLLHNEKIRNVIDTITSKVVLILGRFKPERKMVLNAIREELRKRNYLPILFDFDKPTSRDITETISTLAHMARFIIADITDAKSIPQELQRIVPNLPSVPVKPLLLSSEKEYGMFEHFKSYPWVLEVYLYNDKDSLISSVPEKIIIPAEQKVKELKENKSK